MELEVLLSVLNLDIKSLDKMNITSKCTVINQSDKEEYIKYKNFNIYSYKELGTANSRNRGLEKVTSNIVLLSDNDIIYNSSYEKIILDAFNKNKKADLIVFNVENNYRKKRKIKRNKRLHIYNSLNYASYNIAFRKDSILGIKFNTLFGPNAKYSSGEDTLFIVDALKKGLKLYSNKNYIGKIIYKESTWFKGYNEKYFYDKGALFTAISKRFRHFLMLQYLLRHREILTDIKFFKAYKIMKKGSKEYLNDYSNNKCL